MEEASSFQHKTHALVSELKKILTEHDEREEDSQSVLRSILLLMNVLKTLRSSTDLLNAVVVTAMKSNTEEFELIENHFRRQILVSERSLRKRDSNGSKVDGNLSALLTSEAETSQDNGEKDVQRKESAPEMSTSGASLLSNECAKLSSCQEADVASRSLLSKEKESATEESTPETYKPAAAEKNLLYDSASQLSNESDKPSSLLEAGIKSHSLLSEEDETQENDLSEGEIIDSDTEDGNQSTHESQNNSLNLEPESDKEILDSDTEESRLVIDFDGPSAIDSVEKADDSHDALNDEIAGCACTILNVDSVEEVIEETHFLCENSSENSSVPYEVRRKSIEYLDSVEDVSDAETDTIEQNLRLDGSPHIDRRNAECLPNMEILPPLSSASPRKLNDQLLYPTPDADAMTTDQSSDSESTSSEGSSTSTSSESDEDETTFTVLKDFPATQPNDTLSDDRKRASEQSPNNADGRQDGLESSNGQGSSSSSSSESDEESSYELETISPVKSEVQESVVSPASPVAITAYSGSTAVTVVEAPRREDVISKFGFLTLLTSEYRRSTSSSVSKEHDVRDETAAVPPAAVVIKKEKEDVYKSKLNAEHTRRNTGLVEPEVYVISDDDDEEFYLKILREGIECCSKDKVKYKNKQRREASGLEESQTEGHVTVSQHAALEADDGSSQGYDVFLSEAVREEHQLQQLIEKYCTIRSDGQPMYTYQEIKMWLYGTTIAHEDAGCNSHGRPYKNRKCPACHNMFTGTRNLITHIKRIHLKEKNHVCTYEGCGEAFFQSIELKYHFRDKHSHAHPFVCPNCKRGFNKRSTYNKHKPDVCARPVRNPSQSTTAAATRQEPGIPVYHCRTCGYESNSQITMVNHIRDEHHDVASIPTPPVTPVYEDEESNSGIPPAAQDKMPASNAAPTSSQQLTTQCHVVVKEEQKEPVFDLAQTVSAPKSNTTAATGTACSAKWLPSPIVVKQEAADSVSTPGSSLQTAAVTVNSKVKERKVIRKTKSQRDEAYKDAVQRAFQLTKDARLRSQMKCCTERNPDQSECRWFFADLTQLTHHLNKFHKPGGKYYEKNIKKMLAARQKKTSSQCTNGNVVTTTTTTERNSPECKAVNSLKGASPLKSDDKEMKQQPVKTLLPVKPAASPKISPNVAEEDQDQPVVSAVDKSATLHDKSAATIPLNTSPGAVIAACLATCDRGAAMDKTSAVPDPIFDKTSSGKKLLKLKRPSTDNLPSSFVNPKRQKIRLPVSTAATTSPVQEENNPNSGNRKVLLTEKKHRNQHKTAASTIHRNKINNKAADDGRFNHEKCRAFQPVKTYEYNHTSVPTVHERLNTGYGLTADRNRYIMRDARDAILNVYTEENSNRNDHFCRPCRMLFKAVRDKEEHDFSYHSRDGLYQDGRERPLTVHRINHRVKCRIRHSSYKETQRALDKDLRNRLLPR